MAILHHPQSTLAELLVTFTSAKEVGYSPLSVHPSFCLSVLRFVQKVRSSFVKSRRIVEYCNEKNPLNVGVDCVENSRPAAILDF